MSVSIKLLARFRKQFENDRLRHFVFVYGTLKKNQPNHKVLLNDVNGQAKFICIARTLQKWPLVIASQYNIPYLLEKPETGHQIQGELYLIDEQMLNFLDEFEGHPDYYHRRKTDIITDDFGSFESWTYFLPNYKTSMLSLPMYSDYDSFGQHGLRYVERCDRDGQNADVGHTETSEIIS